MKKLMCAVAAVAAGVAFAEEAPAVASANVVGYQTYTLVPGLNMISDAFLKVDGEGKILINDLIPNQKEVCNASSDFDGMADEILLYEDGNGYSGANTFFFYAYPEEPDPYYDYKWCAESTSEWDTEYEPTVRSNPVGKGFFYWNHGTEPITVSFAGRVSPEAAQWTIVPGLNMLANPYPVDLPINGVIDWKTLGAQDSTDFDGTADEILLYEDGNGYSGANTFFFYAYPDEPDPYYDYKFCAESTSEWDTEYEPTVRSIPAGKGFFYWRRANTGMTVSLTSPVAKTEE